MGIIINGTPRGALPTASGAGQVPVSAGAGTAYASRGLTAADVSGVGVSTGTYAARPGSPSIGDQYLVTSGPRRGSLYLCRVAGRWSRPVIDYGLGDTVATAIVDGEDLPQHQGMVLRAWPTTGREDAARIVSGYSAPTIVASSLGGMPCAAFAGGNWLRLEAPPAGLGSDKTVIVAVSGVSAGGNNGICALANASGASGTVGLFANFTGSGISGPCVEYDAGTLYNGGTALGAGAGLRTIAWTWDSATATSSLFLNGSPVATPTNVPGASRGVLGPSSYWLFGGGRGFSAAGTFNLHGAVAAARRLSGAEIAAVCALITERFPT
jgi:hypothetical protein